MRSVVDSAVNGGQVERGSSSQKQMGAVDGCCSSLPTEYVIAHYTVCRNWKLCTAFLRHVLSSQADTVEILSLFGFLLQFLSRLRLITGQKVTKRFVFWLHAVSVHTQALFIRVFFESC